MRIPGDKEWSGGYGCLDGQCAFKNFNGVSFDQAVNMFQHSSHVFQEDLHYMPIKCCEFYFKAYAEYILSDNSRDDYEGAMYFISAFTSLEKELLEFEVAVREYIVSAASFIVENEELFDEDGVLDEADEKRLRKMKVLKLA